MSKQLIDQLKAYDPYDEQEACDCLLMMKYIHTFTDVYERSNQFGHMTYSPWILNQDYTKVLMIYHNIYNSWGWCGGHCDGDRDMLHVALKEGMEETGLHSIIPVCDDILSLEVLPVTAHYKNGAFVSAHVHLNVTYLCIADDKEALHIKPDENSGVKWISIDDIDTYVSEVGMKPIYHKLIEKSKFLLQKI